MAKKYYYSMGEVAEMLDVEPTVIRYWCSQFSCMSPKRNAKGNRLFTAQDVERLKRIHHLLRERKMTIEGANKAMRRRAIEAESSDSGIALLEQLQTLRAMLVEMRESLGEEQPVEEGSNTLSEVSAQEVQTEDSPKKKRTPRRKLIGEEGVVERPLFPFYEQTLF